MTNPEEDPVLVSSRREAIAVSAIFVAAMAYTVTYCAWYGYDGDADDLRFIFGFPAWVFWGIIVPWGVWTVVSVLFSAFYMRDEQLVDDGDASDDEFDLES